MIVPQTPSTHTSTVPSLLVLPLTSLRLPLTQSAEGEGEREGGREGGREGRKKIERDRGRKGGRRRMDNEGLILSVLNNTICSLNLSNHTYHAS